MTRRKSSPRTPIVIHFTRETADATALEVRDNPRIACIEVSAAIGEGLA